MKINVNSKDIEDILLEAAKSLLFNELINESVDVDGKYLINESIKYQGNLLFEDLRLFDDDGNPTKEAKIPNEKGLRYVNKMIKNSNPEDYTVTKRGTKYFFRPKKERGFVLNIGKEEFLVVIVYENHDNRMIFEKFWLFPTNGGTPKNPSASLRKSLGTNIRKSHMVNFPAEYVKMKRGPKGKTDFIVDAPKEKTLKKDRVTVGTIDIGDEDEEVETPTQVDSADVDSSEEIGVSNDSNEIVNDFEEVVENEFMDQMEYWLSTHDGVDDETKAKIKNQTIDIKSVMNSLSTNGQKLGDYVKGLATKISSAYKENEPRIKEKGKEIGASVTDIAKKQTKKLSGLANEYGRKAFKTAITALKKGLEHAKEKREASKNGEHTVLNQTVPQGKVMGSQPNRRYKTVRRK